MLGQLAEALLRITDQVGAAAPPVSSVPGLTLLRSDHPGRPSYMIFKPALCIVAQGAKWAVFGKTQIKYKAGQALVINVTMPALGTVTEASDSEPYLGVIIEFDLRIMREVADQMDLRLHDKKESARGVLLAAIEGPLEECALRMVRLHQTPEAIPVLYVSIMRELCYWLLAGPHGGEIMNMALAKSHAPNIIHAIHLLRDRFLDRLQIPELAAVAQMSTSAFHRKFKEMTSMTPIQYQKRLRLLEARRLLASEESNVESAAFKVGYESPSQFSREYARMFGVPPRRDILSMRILVM